MHLFQVISGGNYDVDVEIYGPKEKQLYKDTRKQYDSYTWVAIPEGEYKFCFSNEFSSFTHKLIYFDFQAGEDDALVRDLGSPITAMTQVCCIYHRNRTFCVLKIKYLNGSKR